MEARNRNVEAWFGEIASGKLRLPRFQRFEAWNYKTISSFLESVLKGLPVGVALILEIGERQTFKSRTLNGVVGPLERCTEHLLDGQQRLTALWRALTNDYEDRVFLIHTTQSGDITVEPKYPRQWMDDPVKCWDRGFVPVFICRPGVSGEEQAKRWKRDAAGQGPEQFERFQHITEVVDRYRIKISSFSIPFLSLPVSTPSDTAIDVFVKMNTNKTQLTAYDIVVAQFEARTGESLHDRLASLRAEVPHLGTYRSNVANLLLHIAALREGKPLRKSSFLDLDLRELLDNFPVIVKGAAFAVRVLRDEYVFDQTRLLTADVISVLSAMHEHLPNDPDDLGNAMSLIRAYLWRAFSTNRYESGSNTGTLQDLRGMIEVLKGRTNTAYIFDEDRYPLPRTSDFLRAGWPRRRSRASLTVLCASLRYGALDLADGSKVTPDNIASREYHHLFPEAYLDQKLPSEGIDVAQRALNCALLTPSTNRRIQAKAPLAYLRDRINNSSLGEQEIRRRLESHLIPWEEFKTNDADVQGAYRRFLEARAELIVGAITDLCHGREPNTS